ncbi:MAG TPA: peptidoglycan DD-metalloendopeptidase family protein [Flavisolibacter sp.]|jgi:septal ring factor EnvC (AmiA/AmiB activator)|nr:peptidoglycan DD-metalloendopeptidase family protein [Flavisolibacter sp.]
MKKATLLLLPLLFGIVLQAQQVDKSKLESERKALQKELSEIQGVYNKVKGQKKETIGQLNLLQKRLSVQGKYIGNINKEIRFISDDIYTSTVEINKLQRRLDTLKVQYANSVVYAYKNRSNYDYLNFIFSANSFNDALKRISYLRSYRVYRQEQVANILETQKGIEDRKNQLLGKKTQKSSALQNQTQQLKVLEVQKKEKDQVVASLKSKESELAGQIALRKKKDAQLKASISAIIRREIEARRKAEEAERLRRKQEADALAARERASSAPADNAAAAPEKKATTKKAAPVSAPLNAKEVALSSSFSSNKGKLPWPVDDGFVSIPYGSYSVPGTSLKGDNPGLTISTPSPGTAVKAIFDGEVLSVFNLGDGTMAVTISHGKYFTTYSNISNIAVSKGSNVRTGQVIGRAAADDEGGSGGKLDFILMIDLNNVNPSPWLRR